MSGLIAKCLPAGLPLRNYPKPEVQLCLESAPAAFWIYSRFLVLHPLHLVFRSRLRWNSWLDLINRLLPRHFHRCSSILEHPRPPHAYLLLQPFQRDLPLVPERCSQTRFPVLPQEHPSRFPHRSNRCRLLRAVHRRHRSQKMECRSLPTELDQSADCRLAWIPPLQARKPGWPTACLPRSHSRWLLERRSLRSLRPLQVVPVAFLPLRAGPQPAELQLVVAQQLVARPFAAQEVVGSLAGFHRRQGFPLHPLHCLLERERRRPPKRLLSLQQHLPTHPLPPRFLLRQRSLQQRASAGQRCRHRHSRCSSP
jgi:hypothetical protein